MIDMTLIYALIGWGGLVIMLCYWTFNAIREGYYSIRYRSDLDYLPMLGATIIMVIILYYLFSSRPFEIDFHMVIKNG